MRLFEGWINFPFTPNERSVIIINNRYIRVTSPVAERLKTEDLKILGSFRKIWKIYENYCLVLSPSPKRRILSVLAKFSWKTEIEPFPSRAISLENLGLSRIFCKWLSLEISCFLLLTFSRPLWFVSQFL